MKLGTGVEDAIDAERLRECVLRLSGGRVAALAMGMAEQEDTVLRCERERWGLGEDEDEEDEIEEEGEDESLGEDEGENEGDDEEDAVDDTEEDEDEEESDDAVPVASE